MMQSEKESQFKPLISVVIVNWNGLSDTKECIKHTRNQTYENYELIIVDNGSTDGSHEYLSGLSDITYIRNQTNRGFTGGHIAGLSAAKGDFILLLNNDAIMDYDYLARGVAYLSDKPDIAVLGGRAYHWNESNPLFDTSNEYYAYQNINPITAEGIFTQKDEGIPRQVNNVSGSCVFVRTDVINKVGYLHDPYFAYYEESDLFARIKRAGYKIVYHPELAIWHANGKTSAKKGSSFFFYMTMRNRYRFAVRNFDRWSLIRFMKFYILMGVVSSLKSLMPHSDFAMDRAYARAFWRNSLLGWVAYLERWRLRRLLGSKQNYNSMIVREQVGISIVVSCQTKQLVDTCRQLVDRIEPWDEIVIVVPPGPVATYAQSFSNINSRPLRLCINRSLLNTSAENLGIVSSRGQWVIITDDIESFSYKSWQACVDSVYTLRKHSYHIRALRDGSNLTLFARSDFIRNGGGIDSAIDLHSALEAYIFAIQKNNVVSMTAWSDDFKQSVKRISHNLHEASDFENSTKPFQRFFKRHYHFQQLYYLIAWGLSPHVTLRLRLARVRNILMALCRLDRKSLATELKHIRNEMLVKKYAVADLPERKRQELRLLEQRLKKPEITPVFIITRDRLAPLKKLLEWFEKQGVHNIILLDNDSALPPLVDYLNNTPYQVIETGRNVGHTVPWSSAIIKLLAPTDFYIVSDPDVIPTLDSIEVIEHLYRVHQRFPNHLKVGLGLKIDDLPDAYVLKNDVMSWESQFWKHPLEPEVYEAGVDTTFALYKPYTYTYFLHPSLRTGEPYTARHLPWYNDNSKLTVEDVFYRLRADQNVNTWDKGKLPDRYIDELKRQR